MENKQKIWLAVSLLMFLIPEILWGGISDFFCGFLKNKACSFAVFNPVDSNLFNQLVILFEFVSLSFFYVASLFLIKNIYFKIFFIIIVGILLLLTFYLLLFSFNFNPQLG